MTYSEIVTVILYATQEFPGYAMGSLYIMKKSALFKLLVGRLNCLVDFAQIWFFSIARNEENGVGTCDLIVQDSSSSRP